MPKCSLTMNIKLFKPESSLLKEYIEFFYILTRTKDEQDKYKEDLKCANEATVMLANGENYYCLANSIQTKIHIQLYLKEYSE
jgi:hypothetical protein